MKTIAGPEDLREFGISYLTGEADALGYRGLYDLTEEGRALVAEAFGLRIEGFPDNWNSGAVASVMLGHEAWRQIAPIALLKCCHTVFDCGRGIVGIEADEQFERAEWRWDDELRKTVETKPPRYCRDDTWQNWPSCYGKPRRFYKCGPGPHEGSRNVHAMSGRTE